MAEASRINFRPGGTGRLFAHGELTLAGGEGTITAPFSNVVSAQATTQGDTAGTAAPAVSWSGRTVTVKGDTTGTYVVWMFGY